MSTWVKVMVAALAVFVLLNGVLVVRYYLGRNEVVRINRELVKHQVALEPIEHLEVLPVVEFSAAQPELKTEAGTSFLLKTDNDTILFDVGYNKDKDEVSPLLHNMRELGLRFEDIDALAISHNHADHVGGLGFVDARIELTNGPVDLGGKKVYTPVPMSCASATTETVDGPGLIGQDIASTGPLAVQMFVTGKLVEQALMVNVENKGLVLISGCGHPQLIPMVEAAQEITGLPVYAVVGGTHLYTTTGNSGLGGKIFGGNKLYCKSPTQAEVSGIIDQLKELGVQKAYISPHDSDQPTLELFAEKYGPNFQELKAGETILF